MSKYPRDRLRWIGNGDPIFSPKTPGRGVDKNVRIRGLRSKQGSPGIIRARAVPDWEPRVPAREGLKKTLSRFALPSERVREGS